MGKLMKLKKNYQKIILRKYQTYDVILDKTNKFRKTVNDGTT